MSAPLNPLDVLEALVEACPQSGPDATDLDVDHEALVAVVHAAYVALYAAGRSLP